MGRIIYILVVVFDVLAILDIIGSPKELEKKILWIAVVLLIPFFGALAWFAISKKFIQL